MWLICVTTFVDRHRSILEVFKISGTTPVEMDALKMWVKISESSHAVIFIILLGMLVHPLLLSRSKERLSTRVSVTGDMKKLGSLLLH